MKSFSSLCAAISSLIMAFFGGSLLWEVIHRAFTSQPFADAVKATPAVPFAAKHLWIILVALLFLGIGIVGVGGYLGRDN